MSQPTSGFAPGDDDVAVGILSKFDGGGISPELFAALSRITPQAIVEVVVLRIRDGRVEALLIPRPAGDPTWPGMCHTPGTALRNADFLRGGESPLPWAFGRIKREISNDLVGEPTFVGVHYSMGPQQERGHSVSQVFVGEIPEDSVLPEGGFWYPVLDLPELPTFIQSQLPFVQMAAEYYRRMKEGAP